MLRFDIEMILFSLMIIYKAVARLQVCLCVLIFETLLIHTDL